MVIMPILAEQSRWEDKKMKIHLIEDEMNLRAICIKFSASTGSVERRFHAMPMHHSASGILVSANRICGTRISCTALGAILTPKPARTKFSTVKNTSAS